jgi:hypothetical protein
VGLWRRQPAAWTVAVIYLCMAAAHSIMFLTPRYPYVKLPLVIMGLGLALAALPPRAAAALAATLALAAVAASLAMAL